jgi:hypothetical protein
MKDKYAIELLKKGFYGEKSKSEYEYKQLMRFSNKCLYEVKETWGYQYEVILFRTFTSFITQKTQEIYPSDALLGKRLWRFDDYHDAYDFYNNLDA